MQEYTWAILTLKSSPPFVSGAGCRRLLTQHYFHCSVLHSLKGSHEFWNDCWESDRPKHTSTQLYSLKRKCSAEVHRLLHTKQTNTVIKQDSEAFQLSLMFFTSDGHFLKHCEQNIALCWGCCSADDTL